MNSVLFTSCTILFLCVAVHAKYEALIFDRVYHVVFNLSNNLGEGEKCGAVATACAMHELQNGPDKQFLEKCSISNNALVVRNTYGRGSPANLVKKYICEKPFNISLVYNIGLMKRVFEFGFEIFYSADKDHEFASSDYRNYLTFKEAIQMLGSPSSKGTFYGKELLSRTQDLFSKSANSRTKWYNDNKKMIFIWIPMFTMKYSYSKMIVKNVTYEIRRNPGGQIAPKCKDNEFTLGSEAYADIEGSIESLYANQVEIFKELNTPSISPPCEGESCPLPEKCETKNECLEKWSLIPMDQFHLFRSSPRLCSNMLTIPIWKDAVKGALEKLDQYLYALFRLLDKDNERLHVIAGVSSSALKLPLKNKSKKTGIVYLYPQKSKIPAPEFIFKLVKYRPRACESKVKTCEYAVIFIIHNDPNFKPGDKICSKKEDFTTDWGWSGITMDNSGKEYTNIYACPNNKAVLKEIYGTASLSKPSPTSKNLNLKKFPVYDKIDKIINEDNDIVRKVDEMLAKEETLEFKEIINWYQVNSKNVEDIDEDSEPDSPKADIPRK